MYACITFNRAILTYLHDKTFLLQNQYDYIIAGAGCAGLSLLFRLLQEPTLRDKKILVIDRSQKKENDRTWCFWEQGEGLFEPIVHHQWSELLFHSNSFSKKLLLAPYSYKMIRGVDFYEHVLIYATGFSNIEFKYEEIESISTEGEKAMLYSSEHSYAADYIFNSILFASPKGKYNLLQHFKGWLIETKLPSFDAGVATFMDFRVPQEKGCTFFYVLPVSSTQALVEYTLFSEKVLQQDEYDQALKTYISEQLQIKEYEIVHEEFGIIPMTDHVFPLQDGRIINMGVAGGQVKGSTGFAFNFIQKRTRKIVESLTKHGHPFLKKTIVDKKFRLYDKVLLHVLQHKLMQGELIFEKIFKQNDVQRVLRFLDNESSLIDDLAIMNSMPSKIFLPAILKSLF
jgi:lycopene beta-cyclase